MVMNVIYNWHQRRDYAPAGVEMAFAQTVQGAHGAIVVPDYQAILGECCYCCIGMLYANDDWQDAMIAYIASAWSCDKPQCFGHGYTYNYGSFGQILAADTNSAEVSRIAQCTTDPVVGWLKAAAYAAHSCCITIDHPEMSVQGPNFGVLAVSASAGSLLPVLHVRRAAVAASHWLRRHRSAARRHRRDDPADGRQRRHQQSLRRERSSQRDVVERQLASSGRSDCGSDGYRTWDRWWALGCSPRTPRCRPACAAPTRA